MPLDSFGRDIHYLRISLTDKCNMRCVYCMAEDMVFQPSAELMSTAEILRLVNLFAQLDDDKLRLTGGEPTVHPDLIPIVRGIRSAGISRVSMTTNGASHSAGKTAERGRAGTCTASCGPIHG